MYPNRHQNSLPPPSSSNANTKEVIGDLCDRIKSEYTNMYSHIQNLKSELDKAVSARADYERYYTLNQDMTFMFNNEVHKMMDVIKRLTSACMQQVPFLPPELQQSCVYLVEQAKHYTNNDNSPLTPFIPPHGMPPGQPPPPHMMAPQHHMNPPPPPHGGGAPMMPPPPMMSGSHIPPPSHHSMMSPYGPRMAPPSGMPPHCPPDSRDLYSQYPGDLYRHGMGRDKDYFAPDKINENGNGTYLKERNAPTPISSNNNRPTNQMPSNIPPTSFSGQPNSRVNPSEQNSAAESPKELQENDTVSERLEQQINPKLDTINEEASCSEESSEDKSISSSVAQKTTNSANNNNSNKRGNEGDSASVRTGYNSPSKQCKVTDRGAQLPSNQNIPSSAQRQNSGSASQKFTSYTPGIPRPSTNGSHMMESASQMPYPISGPPPPPGFMRPPPMPPFDQMMMPRANMPMTPFPPIPSYNMPPIVSPGYSHYDYPDNGYNSSSGVPRSFNLMSTLQHGDVVCAVSFSSPHNYAFTGSKGTVKIWDITEPVAPKLLSSLECLKDSYVRACRSLNDNKLLIVSGEYSGVGIWSLTPNNGGLSVNTVCELTNPAPVCYDMAVTPDEKQCYCCCSNGSIIGWDIESSRVVRSFTGHVDGATCVDISRDGNLIWSGGLDATARCWDIREGKQVNTFTYPTQVFSLCISPNSDFLIVGLENKTIELCYLKSDPGRFGERHIFRVHETCVLTVKLAHTGKWLVSSSKDNYTNCVKMPQGVPLFMTRENGSILCTDIAVEDKYVLTGGGEKKASIYECVYS